LPDSEKEFLFFLEEAYDGMVFIYLFFKGFLQIGFELLPQDFIIYALTHYTIFTKILKFIFIF
jgi:hypothetical protein